MPVMETRKKRGGAYGKRKEDCGGNNTPDTPTVTETKKQRPYKRKNYGGDTAKDTSTSVMKKRKDSGGDTSNTAVTEMHKERAYGKRKDGGGDTSISVVKKRKDCRGDTADTTTVTEIKKKRPYRRKKCLPQDLILEEILTKLPVRALLKSVLVSKIWYNYIIKDHKRLTYSHFLQSQKKPEVVFSLLNVKNGAVEQETGHPMYGCHFFKFTDGICNSETALQFDKFRGGLIGRDIWELVGYCRGLPCMALVGDHSTAYIILDPNRRDYLFIHPAKVGEHFSSATIICHGFGFDASANEYKLVSVFRTTQKDLNIVVFTLGTKSWRNVTGTSTPTLALGRRPITKIRAATGSDRYPIFCTASNSSSGCLVWKIVTTLGGAVSNHIQHDDNGNDVNNEIEMLLSFNLHDEKSQFIQLPAKSTTVEQQKHLVVDYPHLLEFKGAPCIARIEKRSGNGCDSYHRCRDDHKGSSGSCCCCCKVHLYLLKDHFKQVWVKEETFDVGIKSTPTWSSKLAPEPCCFCFISTSTPPTRIFSFSDQMLLYWLNGKYLQIYNLRSEKLQLVMPFRRKVDILFRAKMKEPRPDFNSGEDDIYCSNMDYQLHLHEENFLSLQTFIPEGVEGVDADVFNTLDLSREDGPCSAYVFICRGLKMFYPFLN